MSYFNVVDDQPWKNKPVVVLNGVDAVVVLDVVATVVVLYVIDTVVVPVAVLDVVAAVVVVVEAVFPCVFYTIADNNTRQSPDKQEILLSTPKLLLALFSPLFCLRIGYLSYCFVDSAAKIR